MENDYEELQYHAELCFVSFLPGGEKLSEFDK
jgi:hypothetical protein